MLLLRSDWFTRALTLLMDSSVSSSPPTPPHLPAPSCLSGGGQHNSMGPFYHGVLPHHWPRGMNPPDRVWPEASWSHESKKLSSFTLDCLDILSKRKRSLPTQPESWKKQKQNKIRNQLWTKKREGGRLLVHFCDLLEVTVPWSTSTHCHKC